VEVAMRIGVTGGRDFVDAGMARWILRQQPDGILVNGGASGADMICARIWGLEMGRKVETHVAHWYARCRPECRPGHRRVRDGRSYCPAAGVYRNQEMVDSGLDRVIVFPGGRGTADMQARCITAGVEVVTAKPWQLTEERSEQ
jgi:hypothetical protein